MLEKWSFEWSEERIQVGVGKEEGMQHMAKVGLALSGQKASRKALVIFLVKNLQRERREKAEKHRKRIRSVPTLNLPEVSLHQGETMLKLDEFGPP